MADNRSVAVHLGLAKTGTTFLQQALFKVHPQILYLGKNCDDLELDGAGKSLVRLGSLQFDAEAARDRFRWALANAKDRAPLYSEEDLSVFKFQDIELFAARLAYCLGDFDPFLVIRNPLTWLESQYFFRLSTLVPTALLGFDHWIKTHWAIKGAGSDVAELHFGSVIRTYKRYSAKGTVQVLPYERLKRDKLAYLDAISRLCSVDAAITRSIVAAAGSNRNRDKERMNTVQAEFLLSCSGLVTDDLPAVLKSVAAALAAAPAAGRPAVAAQAAFEEAQRNPTDGKLVRQAVLRVSALLAEDAQSPAASVNWRPGWMARISKLVAEQIHGVAELRALDLPSLGYPMPDAVTGGVVAGSAGQGHAAPESRAAAAEEAPAQPAGHDDASVAPAAYTWQTAAQAIIADPANVQYGDLAAQLYARGMIDRTARERLERRRVLPEALRKQLDPQEPMAVVPAASIPGATMIEAFSSEGSHTLAPVEVFRGRNDPTRPARKVTSPAVHVLSLRNCKLLTDSNQQLLVCEGRIVEEFSDSTAYWLAPRLAAFPTVHLRERVLYLREPGASLFSHWLGDLLPKFGALERAGIDLASFDRILLNGPGNSFQKECLKLAGVSLDRVQFISKRHRVLDCADLTMVTPVRKAYYTPSWAVDFLHRLMLAGTKGRSGAAATRLYISREDASRRRLLNDAELSAQLGKLGFQTVLASKMSVREMASLCASSQLIVGCHGAGLANLVFMPETAATIEIFGPHWSTEFWTVARARKQRYALCEGDFDTNPDLPHVQKNAADFAVDVESVVSCVQALI